MRRLLLGLAPIMMFASTISFDEALQETFANNIELKAKKMEVDIAKQDLLKAKSYDYGKFFVSEDISRTNNALYVFGNKLESREATMGDFGFSVMPPAGTKVGHVVPDALNKPAPRNNFKTKFVYELPLFTGFKIKFAKEIAKLQIKAKEFKFQRDKNKLAIEVLKAYNGAVAAKYFIKALKSAKTTTTSFVTMTQNLFEQGMIVQSDVLSAEARDSEVDARIIEAQNQYNLALAYLRFLTGDDNISDVQDFKIIISPNAKLIELQNEALKNRSDVKWMKKNVVTMNKKVKMDENVKYPVAGMHVEYGFNDDHLTGSKDKDYFLLAANISYNFINAGDKEELEKSRIKANQTALYFKYMQNGIKVDVEQKLSNLKAKSSVIKMKVKNKDLAHSVLNQYKEMYQNGLINIAILLMKQAESQKADAELIKAKYDQAIAAAELKLAVGSSILKKGENK
jgi:outer membrane protein TolC